MQGKDADVDPELAGLFREYQFRKLFGTTHEQYLDEPMATVEWLLAIHGLVSEVEHGNTE